MKTDIEIEMKQIRNRLKIHTLTSEEKKILRSKLDHLKTIYKKQRN